MNAESFKQTLTNHCREEIQELYYECKHYGEFNPKDFSARLDYIWTEAKISGMEPDEFKLIVDSVLNDSSDSIEYPFDVLAA